MTRNYSGHARRRAAPGSPSAASGRALVGLLGLLLLLGSTGANAAGGRQRLGWSTTPRWRLPPVRRLDCPEGQALARDGALVPARKARCIETGPKSQGAKARPAATRISNRASSATSTCWAKARTCSRR